ncbi:MAG: hypothetical protein HC831_02710 [Chloroflexia bacterium]|nr:hypothetical protein [Chloroflexia bacterium]
MSKLLIKNAKCIVNETLVKTDILIDKEQISKVSEFIEEMGNESENY